ncbi:MAG: hypothetical protein WCI71_18045, partial [Bacteroidota bacterium]
MKKLSFFVVFLLVNSSLSFAQVGINTDNSAPDPSAMLDVKSTSMGLLVPRMTLSDRDAISNPANGLLIFCTTNNQYYSNKGTPSTPNWVMVSSQWLMAGSDIYFSGGKVGLGTSPAYNLDVVGDINLSGTLRKNGLPVVTGVSSVTGTLPIISSGGNNPNISITQANSTTNGFLSWADWLLFSNKQNALTIGNLTSGDITVSGGNGSVIGTGTSLSVIKGNLTESTSSVLNVTGGTGAVLAPGASIEVKKSNASQSGYLSSADWNTFNNKVSSQWVSNGAKLYYNLGNVGIGASNPQNKIDIAGSAVIGSSYSGSSTAPANGLLVEGRVGVGTVSPATSAALDVTSTTSGVLLPRITKNQRDAIVSPANGLMIFCTNCGTDGSLSIYSNGSWKTFSPCILPAPVAGTIVISPGQIIWNWNPVSGATGYKWNTSAVYETATDLGTNLSMTETGIACNTVYTRYLWAYSGCGESEMTTLTQTIPASAPVAPIAGTHISTLTSIIWNWNTVSNATGYKWNTTNDYNTATDIGAVTTKNETGLTCGTGYTRYLWAYNGCGYSNFLTLTQSTWACGTCGSLTVNHVAGTVAPVTKTVTYGTVTNIPGEHSKCWITSNLGANHQATAVNDATELSAGWYWQFNRKQGYKHDGTTRTPN